MCFGCGAALAFPQDGQTVARSRELHASIRGAEVKGAGHPFKLGVVRTRSSCRQRVFPATTLSLQARRCSPRQLRPICGLHTHFGEYRGTQGDQLIWLDADVSS